MIQAQNGPKIIDQSLNLANKRFVREAMQRIAEATPQSILNALQAAYPENGLWRGSHPFNEMSGAEAMAENVWKPLLKSLPDIERRDDILIGGRYRDKSGIDHDLVGCVGHYVGTFKSDWLDIPATGQPIFLRYGEVHEVKDGKIVQSTCIWDVLDFIRQAGFWPLAPSWGMEGRWAAPFTNDGIVLREQDADEGMASITQTLAMHKTLSEYRDEDMAGREGLLNMPQRQHWHPKMMWYGPSGIGTTRGLAGFVDFHQLPFRLFWPGRKGGQSLVETEADPKLGHYVQFGDGPYSLTGGWPSVVIENHGASSLFGSGPVAGRIEMRVMDFYLHHEGLIRENWVPIDIIHVLLQMNIDVLARVRDQFGRNRLGLRD